MTESCCYCTCDGVDVVELAEDELVARSPDRTHAVVLNATASAVLELCNGEHTASDIARFLHEALPNSEIRQVRSDVRAILRELSEAGIVAEMQP